MITCETDSDTTYNCVGAVSGVSRYPSASQDTRDLLHLPSTNIQPTNLACGCCMNKRAFLGLLVTTSATRYCTWHERVTTRTATQRRYPHQLGSAVYEGLGGIYLSFNAIRRIRSHTSRCIPVCACCLVHRSSKPRHRRLLTASATLSVGTTTRCSVEVGIHYYTVTRQISTGNVPSRNIHWKAPPHTVATIATLCFRLYLFFSTHALSVRV